MKTAGTMFLASLIASGKKHYHVVFGDIEHLFTELELPGYQWLKNFSQTYGDMPDLVTFEDAIKVDLPVAQEPPDYYLDLLRSRYTYDNLNAGMQKAQAILGGSHDEAEALGSLAETVMQLIAEKHSVFVKDYREAYDMLMESYYAKKAMTDDGIQLGWPTLDELTGGLVKGDVCSLAGRPGAGKSWLAIHAAHHGWWQQKKPVLFISMEMSSQVIIQRLSAIHTRLPFNHIKDGALGTKGEALFMGALATIKEAENPFWVLDGNLSSSVSNIYAIARQLKPEVIYVDGAYLLTLPKEGNRYMRVAENTDLIKRDLAAICPVIATWQLNRDSLKKKKGESPGLEDIGYADAIGQISSVVIGLFQEETVDNVPGRTVRIMKGRNGEQGAFKVNWNFAQTNFQEQIEQPIGELQY